MAIENTLSEVADFQSSFQPLASFQSRSCLSIPPVKTRCPSEHQPTARTGPSCPVSFFTRVPLVCQMAAKLSSPAEASRLPSGEKATAVTFPLCADQRL